MPIWKGIHGEYFQFSIEGYQFPEIVDDYDANWLFLDVDVQNEQGTWQRRSACILSWEVAWFARWLKNVTFGNCENELSVLEGDFQLVYISKAQGLHRFMVCLEYGLSYVPVKSSERDKSVIGVCLTETEVEEAVTYFEERFTAFPPRGETDKKCYEMLPGPKVFDSG
jgi:hypothetical protein